MEGVLWREPFGFRKKNFSRLLNFEMTSTATDFRKAMTFIFMAKLGLDRNRTADLMGTSRCTAFRDRSNSHNQSDPNKRSWGGRRRFTMSLDEEREFLLEWEVEAKSCGILAVPPIHVVLVKTIGSSHSPISYISNVGSWMAQSAAGHQTSKKSDPVAQEEFKKNSLKKVDTACLMNHSGMPVRLMFQDGARIGRMCDPRS